MAQKRVQQTKAAPNKQDEAVEEVAATVDDEAQKLKDETDALLDEIDEELAENDSMAEFWADIDEALGDNLANAQAFVEGFQQKGGE